MFNSLLALSLVTTLLEPCRGDDMAFVEVSMSGEMDIRYLDFAVPTKAGVAGFFEDSPMFPHDWVSTSTMNTTIAALIKAADTKSSGIASKVASVELALAPLFAALPKTADGSLSDGAVRYALHRYFVRQHGWSLKGLEPAGASLYLQNHSELSEDVQQVSKYVMPTFLMMVVRRAFPVQGYDLRRLALTVVAIEHFAHTEMEEHLFLVYRTLQLPISGRLSEVERNTVISTFLLTYAFGTNLEVSTKRAVEDARAFLNAGHAGWWRLWSRIQDMLTSEAEPLQEFSAVLRFLEAFADRYSEWQGQDCARARHELESSPDVDRGRIPVTKLKPYSVEGGRTLFSESVQDLREVGALDPLAADAGSEQLIVPNYLLSQALCLSTASIYTVCCSTGCEDVLRTVELSVAAPRARPAEVIAALREASDELRAGGWDTARVAEAADADGLVSLHGRPFAALLHSLLPLECPAPGDTAQLGPKTADEWMMEPSLDPEQLVTIEVQHDAALANFVSMGHEPGARDERPSDRLLEEFPVEASYPEPAADPAAGPGLALTAVRLVCMGCVLWAAFTSLASTVSTVKLRSDAKKTNADIIKFV